MSQTSGFQNGEHGRLQVLGRTRIESSAEYGVRGPMGTGARIGGSALAERPRPALVGRLAHEHGLRDELDSAWALRPLELLSQGGRPMQVLEDPDGKPLERQLLAPANRLTEAGGYSLGGRLLALRIGRRRWPWSRTPCGRPLSRAVGRWHPSGPRAVHRRLRPESEWRFPAAVPDPVPAVPYRAREWLGGQIIALTEARRAGRQVRHTHKIWRLQIVPG